jgi:hypothetical protein
MLKNRSKVLFIGAVISTAYILCLAGNYLLKSAVSPYTLSFIVNTAFMPEYILFMAIGTALCWTGFFTRDAYFILLGSILFSIAAVFFFFYISAALPIIVLAYIGFANQKKINSRVSIIILIVKRI